MDCYLGEIRIFAGNYAPAGWAICDGRLLDIQANQTLFSLISNTWGGDGRVTFALPDLRGRLPVGQGAAPGLTARVLGTYGGTETVAVSEAACPTHNHALLATTAAATELTPGPRMVHAAASVQGGTSSAPGLAYATRAVNAPQVLNDATISEEGGGQPHNNLMPALAINFIIALQGTYPVSD
jgi:microcystin-dependent protein